MKTSNDVLHTQLTELFEQHPTLTCLSHNEQGIYFANTGTALHIHYNQVETITTHTDKVIITLCNGVVYTIIPSLDSVNITLF